MADKKQGWLDKAKRQMEKRGTVGAFTEYCGGKVTRSCIDKALNSNDSALQRKARFAASMLNLRKEEGGFKLPGGVMKPIGYGAYKFEGNKHDEAGMGSDSGIILEEGGKGKQGLEVEDGELQVETDQGEYIVSDYIINPRSGNTLAEDLEKELEGAGSKEEADAISKKYVDLNEKLKGKNKKKPKKAQEGTGILDEESDKPYGGGALTAEESKIGEQHITDEDLFGEATLEGFKGTMKDNPWFDWKDFDPTNKEDVTRFQEEYNKRAPEGEEIVVDGKFGTQTQSARLFKPVDKIEPLGPKVESPELEAPTIQGEDKYKKPEEPEETEEATPDTSKRLPLPGTFLQAAGDIAGLLKDYTVNPRKMRPEYAREIRMGRVNLDPERAAAAQSSQAAASNITSSVAGPAALAMQQKNLSAGQQAQRGITDQENRANIQIANQEKGINAGIRQQNVANFMTASKTNASLAAQADKMNRDAKMYKTSLAQNIGDTAAQQYADTQQVKGDMFQAQASQVDGEFDRAYLNYGPKGNFLMPKAKLYPEGNTTLSPEQISAMYNQQAQASTTPEPKADEAKRGRYIKKSNKVRRKKRNKK